MRPKPILAAATLFLFLALKTTLLFAVPVDLNTFTPFGSTVDIAPDGSSAIIYEDPSFTPISLENMAFHVADDAVSLSFDYELIVDAINDDAEDYFDFYINDPVTPAFYAGNFVAAGGSMIYSGSYSHSLLGWQGQDIAVIFDIMAGWDNWSIDSYVTISNLNMSLASESTPIPEPASLFLLLSGIPIIALRRKLFHK